MPDFAPDWTGFGPYNEKELGPKSKTLWDWLDLLIIPIVLTIIAWLFKEFEKVKSDEKEKSAQQSATCDNFIKIITELNLKHALATDKPKQGADKIARSRVNFVLNILDGDRKGLVLQFLYESELINKTPKILLNGANFKDSILDGIVLENSEIKGAYFHKASITSSNLNNSSFIGSDFSGADISNSEVGNTDLSYCNLSNGKIQNMDLTSVNFEGANLNGTDLEGSTIKKEQLNLILNKQGIKTKNAKII